MGMIARTLALALQHHQRGNLKEARELYCQILERDPKQADAWHLLGLIAHQAGEFPLAIELIEKALSWQNSNSDYHNNLGTVQRAAGDLAGAVASYQRAIELRSDSADAHSNLGVALLEQRQAAEAVSCFRRALALQPDHVVALTNLGNALQEVRQMEEAIACYQRALALKSDHAEAYNGLGNAFSALGRLDEASSAYRQALQIWPDLVEAISNLGIVLNHLGQRAEALSCCRQVLRLQPELPAGHINLGNVLRGLGEFEEAADCYRQAVALKPDYALAHNNLGLSLMQQGKMAEALSSYRRALELKPDYTEAYSNLLLALNYDETTDPAALFAEHCAWGRLQEQAAPPAQAHGNEPSPERRLRVGYVSPDFRSHALGRFFQPILAHHDAEQIEAICYAEVPVQDSVTARLKSLAKGWRCTCGLSEAHVADLVRADGIDILVDLAGHTANNRLRVFACRPAPVQVTWLGYPNTSGLSSMDYLLTDEVIHPPGEPTLQTEELVRLARGSCCFAPPPDAPDVGALPALANGRVTFGSLHNLAKLSSSVIELWCRVLKAVPTSRLLLYRDTLKGRTRDHIHRQFTGRGIAEDRLDLRHGSAAPGYLSVYDEIDISLDVFPWGGGTTVYESLWMGVPVLTLRGSRFAERVAASPMTRVGLPECIAETPEQFVGRAVQLAAELDRLASIRSQLRTRMMATVCDAPSFTRCLEDAYRTMWRRWCASRQSGEPA